MSFKLFVALVALGIPLMVQGYSQGAPSSECTSMTPQHHVEAQRGAFPYTITINKNKIRAGETVEVTIKGKKSDDNFKGLLVQARVGQTPIGQFDVSPSKQYIQLLDCGSGRGVSCRIIDHALSFVAKKHAELFTDLNGFSMFFALSC